MPLRVLLALTLLAALAAAPAAHAQGGVLQQAATALQTDNVFVHSDANPGLTQAEADALRSRIADRNGGGMFGGDGGYGGDDGGGGDFGGGDF